MHSFCNSFNPSKFGFFVVLLLQFNDAGCHPGAGASAPSTIRYSNHARFNTNRQFIPGQGLRRPRYRVNTLPTNPLPAEDDRSSRRFVPGEGLKRPVYRKPTKASVEDSSNDQQENNTPQKSPFFVIGVGLRRPNYRPRNNGSNSILPETNKQQHDKNTAPIGKVPQEGMQMPTFPPTKSKDKDAVVPVSSEGPTLILLNQSLIPSEFNGKLYSLCGTGPTPFQLEHNYATADTLEVIHRRKVLDEVILDEDEVFEDEEFEGHFGGPEIANGVDADPIAWPWMTAIYLQTDETITTYWCGGSIINEKYILTAAHCFGIGNESNYFVRIGDHNLASDRDGREYVELDVEKIIIHENYTSALNYHDIALLRVKGTMSYKSHISPVCLPTSEQEGIVGNEVYITGWGDIHFADRSSDILQQGKLGIISNEDCDQRFKKLNQYSTLFPQGISESFICADFGDDNQDACQGDSGGPMVHYNAGWNLVGIISFGVGCSRPGFAGVYTRITTYLDWIESNSVV